MSNKSGWFRKYIWNIFVVKFLLEDLWGINILVGIIAAVFMPNILPLQGLSPLPNQIIYALTFLFITEFVKIVLRIPRKIKTELDDHKEKVGITYYKGLYTLLTNLSQEFQRMEEGLKTAAGESPLRGVLLDFIVDSLASIGRSGFTMVDATVTVYVRYIMQVVQKSREITMTCVVRPYWFVVDEIQDVTLPPYIKESNAYGKGEHLRCFRPGSRQSAIRYLIVDEHMLAEVILSAYIDKYIFKNFSKKNCPICPVVVTGTCPLHNDRIPMGNVDDIPEIYWFKENVNKERGVKVIYTLIRHERRKVHVELDDRIYISEPTPQMDIRFEFTNLEKGILRIRWGDQAMPLASIGRFHTKMNPITGKEDTTGTGHTFYQTFTDILRDNLKTAMIRHLELLEGEIKEYFNEGNITKIRGPDATQISKLLAGGNDNFKKIIVEGAISLLRSDLSSKNLARIYMDLVDFYRSNGAAKVAYIVTHDPAKSEYPVRVARWESNWGKILNAPD